MSKTATLREFKVPSASDPRKVWTVREHEDGVLSCNCPAFRFKGQRLSCKHTDEVHAGAHLAVGETAAQEPEIVLAAVQEVTPQGGRVLCPLIAMGWNGWVGTSGFIATMMVDLMDAGVSWRTVRERFKNLLTGKGREEDFRAAVRQNGRVVEKAPKTFFQGKESPFMLA